MDTAELRTRIDTKLIREHLAGIVEGLQRLGLAAAAVQRDHQQPAHPLAQRVFRDQRGQRGHGLLVAAQVQQHVRALFRGRRPQLGEADPLGGGVGTRNPGEGGAVPFAERAVQCRDRPGQVPGCAHPAAAQQAALEDDGVDLLGVQAQHVTAAG